MHVCVCVCVCVCVLISDGQIICWWHEIACGKID